ncbi:hypothetical protein ACX0HA_02270 [Flavobacterium hauense]
MKNLILITFMVLTALCHAQNKRSLPKTVITEKRIIVTSGKVSNEEFETLIDETLKQYKDRPGIQIIVKAPGHTTFNHKTPDADKPEPIAFRIIRSDEKLNINNLQPEPIKFSLKKDSIYSEHRDSLKIKP